MARSPRSSKRDAEPTPVDTVLDLLRREAKPLEVAVIKRRLEDLGIADVDAVWASVGPLLRAHADVVYARKKYGVAPNEPMVVEVTVAQALAQLGTDLPESQRVALIALVRTELDAMREKVSEADALRERAEEADGLRLRAAEADALRQRAGEVETLRQRMVELEREISELRTAPVEPPVAGGRSHVEYDRAERRRQARERNARIEAMTKVADLAAEVEELVAKRATKEVLLESTRALVSVAGLEQIGTGGERTGYDESLHEPVGDTPEAGTPVIVVRPGYRWRAPGEVVLISRAQVRTA